MWYFYKCFVSRDPSLMKSFFITYVRPLLEYGSVVWSPVSTAGINKIEGVQRSFLKKIYNFSEICYKDRLDRLNLSSLQHRRLITDVMFLFDTLAGEKDIQLNGHVTLREPGITRGHNLRIVIPKVVHNATKRFFISRIARHWNALPNLILDCRNPNSLRLALLSFFPDPFRV